jgi:hypothetical protein
VAWAEHGAGKLPFHHDIIHAAGSFVTLFDASIYLRKFTIKYRYVLFGTFGQLGFVN